MTHPDITPDDAGKFFTLEEVAQRFGLSLQRLRAEAVRGEFEHYHYGKKRLMSEEQISRFLAKHLVRPTVAMRSYPADKRRKAA